MLILGLDAAADPKNFGYVLAEHCSGIRKHIASGTLDAFDLLKAELAKALQADGRLLIAVDAPLGWPAAMGQALSRHRAGQNINVPPNQLFRRETDRQVKSLVGKQPLDIGADRIARAAWSALSVLRRLRCALSDAIPLVWSPDFPEKCGVIEVYPAGSLAGWGLRSSGYKKPEEQAARLEIAGFFQNRAPWLSALVAGQVDVFDAGLCVIAGADFLEKRAVAPRDNDLAAQEGWIWVTSSAKGQPSEGCDPCQENRGKRHGA